MILSSLAEFGLFVGRLHPLVVHLPIGFVILTVVFFWLGRKRKNYYFIQSLPYVLFLVLVSSTIAALLGWALSSDQDYNSEILFWHKWSGVPLVGLSLLAWVISLNNPRFHRGKLGMTIFLMFALVCTSGYFGGKLTHGEGYLLEYAPGFLKRAFNFKRSQQNQLTTFPANPDSILFYNHLIKPILDSKCIACHRPDKNKAELSLDSYASLIDGSSNGPVLVPGDSHGSELFRRISLEQSSEKFMPPKGTALSYHEVRLIDYWISSGLSQHLSITNSEIPEDIQQILSEKYYLSGLKKPYFEIYPAPPASEANLNNLKSLGYMVNTISQTSNYLEVSLSEAMTDERWNALEQVKEQLTWLDLSNIGLDNETVKKLGVFNKLTRLKLDNNPISDEGISSLNELVELNFLNLYGTNITDAGIDFLIDLSKLNKLFLWRTKVTPNGIDKLYEKNKNIEIDLGFEVNINK